MKKSRRSRRSMMFGVTINNQLFLDTDRLGWKKPHSSLRNLCDIHFAPFARNDELISNNHSGKLLVIAISRWLRWLSITDSRRFLFGFLPTDSQESVQICCIDICANPWEIFAMRCDFARLRLPAFAETARRRQALRLTIHLCEPSCLDVFVA